MMGVDTTTKTASAAVMDFDSCKILAQIWSRGQISHSENLMPMIDYAIKCAGVEIIDIGLFAVAHGPGSFTGIRIGIATIKGLAFGAEADNCIGISSLCALAHNFYGIDSGILILPTIDARRKQVYNAVFDNLAYVKSDRIITVGELESELNLEFADRKIAFVGDGAAMCYDEIDFGGKVQIPDMLKNPCAASLCLAAREKYKKGGATHPRALAPAYLIQTQAEREYNEHGKT